MDDGSNHPSGFRLCTQSFTLSDIERLGRVLNDKFGLEWSTHKTAIDGQHMLYIRGSSKAKLRSLVMPYMHPSMHYKLTEGDKEGQEVGAKGAK